LAEELQLKSVCGLGLLSALVLLLPGPLHAGESAETVEAVEVPLGDVLDDNGDAVEGGEAQLKDGEHPVYRLRVEPLDDGEAVSLGLEDILDLAASSNFGLQRQYLTIEKGHYTVDQTYYAFDPALSGSIGYSRRAAGGASARAGGGLSSSESYNLSLGATMPREYGDSFSFNYGLSRASYSIIGGSETPTEIPTTYDATYTIGYSRPLGRGAGTYINRIPRFIASNSLQLAYDQLDDQVRRLKRDVMNGYFQAVAAREAIDVRQSSLEQALGQLDRAVERYKVGLSIRADVLQAENNVLSQRSQLLTAIASYSGLLDNLVSLTGVPQELEIKVDPETALVELGSELPDELWVMVENNSYELKSLNTQRANLLLTREQQADRLKPNIGISLNYGRSGEDSTADLAVTGYENENYSVNLNWSTTPGERDAKATLAQTELDLASLDLSIQETELQLKTALRGLQRDLATKRQQIALSEDNLKVLQENYDIVSTRNEVGLATMLDVVDAQQALLEGQLALLNAKVSYQESYREIQLMAGLI